MNLRLGQIKKKMLLLKQFNITFAYNSFEETLTQCLLLAPSRNLMLKVSILSVLCYHWLGRVVTDFSDVMVNIKFIYF